MIVAIAGGELSRNQTSNFPALITARTIVAESIAAGRPKGKVSALRGIATEPVCTESLELVVHDDADMAMTKTAAMAADSLRV